MSHGTLWRISVRFDVIFDNFGEFTRVFFIGIVVVIATGCVGLYFLDRILESEYFS